MAEQVSSSDDISGLWGSQTESVLSPEPLGPARSVRPERGAVRQVRGDGANGVSVEEKAGIDEAGHAEGVGVENGDGVGPELGRLAESMGAVKAEMAALRHELAELRAVVHYRRSRPRRSPPWERSG